MTTQSICSGSARLLSILWGILTISLLPVHAEESGGAPTPPPPACAHCASPASALSDPAQVKADTSRVAGLIKSLWLDPPLRPRALAESITLTSQDGTKVDLNSLNKPLALSFFYTRCDNERKCPRVVAAMAKLSKVVSKAGLSDEVVLGLVSYDPQFDSPAVLKEYGEKMSVPFGPSLMMLQVDPLEKGQFFKNLQLTVNFDQSGDVNVHGNQLLLIDRSGRLAREYRIVLWNNEEVAADLAKLAAEKASKDSDPLASASPHRPPSH